MSNHLISTTYKRELRTPMRKSVMALLADKASDDGAGIYASKQTMADELCCSKQAVIDTIKGFLDDGLVVELGQRRAPNGYTVEYGIVVAVLEALPLVKCHADRERRRSTSFTGQPPLPVNDDDRSTPLTPPVKLVDPNPPEPTSPDASHPPKARTSEPKIKPFRLPAEWKPVRFADGTVAREVIDQRGQEWARAALESFRHWAANAEDRNGKGRKVDWQAAFAKWVIEQDKRDGRSGTNGMAGHRRAGADSRGSTLDAATRALARHGFGGSGTGNVS
jgi:hypothetical protein